jgi:hypothetical protein
MAPQVMQTLVGRLPLSCPARLVSPSFSPSLSNPTNDNNNNNSTSNDNDTNNNIYKNYYYYSRHSVKSHVFPALIARPATTTTTTESSSSSKTTIINGILYQDLTPNEWKILDWFEDKEYKRIQVIVDETLTTSSTNSSSSTSTDSTTNNNVSTAVAAQTYLWINPHSELDLERNVDWDYERFCKEKLDWYLEHTVRPFRREVERLGYCSSSFSS